MAVMSRKKKSRAVYRPWDAKPELLLGPGDSEPLVALDGPAKGHDVWFEDGQLWASYEATDDDGDWDYCYVRVGTLACQVDGRMPYKRGAG